MIHDHSNTVVIGIGSLERGDDALGLLVAKQLREREDDGLHVVESDGEASRLIELLSDTRRAIIVDAADFGGADGEIRRIDAVAQPVPQTLASFSTHDFGVAQGIEMARALGMLPEQCVVYAVQGTEFAAGATVTEPVRAAVNEVVARIAQDIAANN